jgi:DNA mismatch repair protein MSH4
VDLARILGERNGVISLHLAVEVSNFFIKEAFLTSVQMNNNDAMTMLYRIAQGPVNETHYGLALARVVPFPPGLIEHATHIAQKLERQVQKRKKISITVIKERRRKLILNLKEHLVQAQSGVMDGEVLTAWLKQLQKEFVYRMAAIDADVASAEQERESDGDDEMENGPENGEVRHEDDEMKDWSESSKVKLENHQEPPATQSTQTRQPSVISISSHTTSTELESTNRAVSENDF